MSLSPYDLGLSLDEFLKFVFYLERVKVRVSQEMGDLYIQNSKLNCECLCYTKSVNNLALVVVIKLFKM